MKEDYRLLNIRDINAGVGTTILIQLDRFPDNARIVYIRGREHLVFHQIGGTYNTLKDFHNARQRCKEKVEKTVLCPKCGQPITYFTPNLDELVNFTCMNILDARRLTNALIELLRDQADG